MGHNYWARALEPKSHNSWARALEPKSHNSWAPVLQGLKPMRATARAPQQERAPQWEALHRN